MTTDPGKLMAPPRPAGAEARPIARRRSDPRTLDGPGHVSGALWQFPVKRSWVPAMASLNVIAVAVAPQGAPVETMLLASALLWVGAFPLLRFLAEKPREAPIFPIICLLYFVYFGMPVFNDSVLLIHRRYDADKVTEALALSLGGLVAMQIGFYSKAGKVLGACLPQLSFEVDLPRLASRFAMVATIGVAATIVFLGGSVAVPNSLVALTRAVISAPLMLFCGLFLLYLRRQLPLSLTLISSAAYGTLILFSLGTSFLAKVALALAPLFFTYMAERRRVPWRAAVLCLALVLPFANVKHQFRAELRRNPVTGLARIEQFVGLAQDSVRFRGTRFTEDSAKTAATRTNYLATFVDILRQTPERVPFLYGDTYRIFLWAFVPRVIAPDRPMQSLGQEFGHRYGFLRPNDGQSSCNLAQMVELYVNFGRAGVVAGMLFFGLYYRLLYSIFNRGARGDGMILLTATALTGLLNIESDAAVLVGGLQLCIFYYLLLKVMCFGHSGPGGVARAL